MSEQASDKLCSEEQVRDYLREHKNFFERHPDLLEEINLPHASGQAVSLVERQVALLRERNIDMRRRLAKLLDNARDNDKLFGHTRELVLRLLECRELNQVVNTLLQSFSKDFEIPYTSLLLFSESAELEDSRARSCNLQEAKASLGRILANNKSVCGNFPQEELDYIFPEQGSEVGSAALMPLVDGHCYGLLAVGNSDPDYYRSSMGTLFLSYIGEVLNRVLPGHLPAD